MSSDALSLAMICMDVAVASLPRATFEVDLHCRVSAGVPAS